MIWSFYFIKALNWIKTGIKTKAVGLDCCKDSCDALSSCLFPFLSAAFDWILSFFLVITSTSAGWGVSFNISHTTQRYLFGSDLWSEPLWWVLCGTCSWDEPSSRSSWLLRSQRSTCWEVKVPIVQLTVGTGLWDWSPWKLVRTKEEEVEKWGRLKWEGTHDLLWMCFYLDKNIPSPWPSFVLGHRSWCFRKHQWALHGHVCVRSMTPQWSPLAWWRHPHVQLSSNHTCKYHL